MSTIAVMEGSGRQGMIARGYSPGAAAGEAATEMEVMQLTPGG
jgi:hypothetical protein